MTVVSENNVEEARRTGAQERARLSRALEKLILASIGAVALGQETLESLLSRMIERGERVQEAMRKQVGALSGNRRYLIRPGMQKVETVLDAADLPSKADILSLQDQIAALSAKIEQLSQEKAKRTPQAQP
jgi:polyhydroxyalkanoate synthesis regulator phasin